VLLLLVNQKLCQELKLGLGRSDGGGEVAVALVVFAFRKQLGLLVVVPVNDDWRIERQCRRVKGIISPKVLLN
jgi:hypothetical protein